MNSHYPKNVINWFDIPTNDLERAVKFYSTILDFKMNIVDFGGMKMAPFRMQDEGVSGAGSGCVGGALMQPMSENKPSANGTHVHLNVDGRLDEVLSRVEKAGGKIIAPKMFLSDPGWDAMIMDTEGNMIGLHSYK